jgi:Rrf2 family nitric oxide-sensitive transcriptional repressor
MHLTAHTDYALRVMMYVALVTPQTTTIDEIAERYELSRNHLMKIVQRLAAAGLLETLRGRGGGMRLGRPAPEIRVGDIVRTAEGSFQLVECHDAARNRCRISGSCLLRGVLDEAVAAFLQVLDGKTLADMIANQEHLRADLKFSAVTPIVVHVDQSFRTG